MKKFSCLLLSFMFIITLFAVPTNAEAISTAVDVETVVETFEDGSYITVSAPKFTIVNSARSTATNIEAEQTATYTNSSDEVEWEYIFTATFSYVYGTSATCTGSNYDYTIYDSSWNFSNGSSSYSGATAYAFGTFKNKVLFITTKTVDVDLSMTCDVYGNLS